MSDKVINVGEIDISGTDLLEQQGDLNLEELSAEELERRKRMANLMLTRFTGSSLNWKSRLKGFPSYGAVKPIKFWYNGTLISKKEHDQLPVEEVLAYNNIISKPAK